MSLLRRPRFLALCTVMAGPVFTQLVRNGPSSGVGLTSISGLNFGSSDSTVSATVGSVVCGTASWTTSTTVRCYAGMSTGGIAQYLTVAGLVGTGTGVLSFDGAHAFFRARH